MTVRAYIGIGSNLDNPVAQVKEAIAELEYLPDSVFFAKSSLYSCKPMGPADQPDYVNAVAAVDTLLSAESLYSELVKIEDMQGRTRDGEKWGPRILDLDLLLYGKNKIKKKNLVVPHPGMHERDFVIIPLAEIAGNISIPGKGKLGGLLGQCENHSVKKLVTG
jgi:2-amino-4-hydroxy-6-hydroxymethyldihydropteridine diphosphokinase